MECRGPRSPGSSISPVHALAPIKNDAIETAGEAEALLDAWLDEAACSRIAPVAAVE